MFLLTEKRMTSSAIAPATNRTAVKLAASIAPSFSAMRHRIEFPAKAIKARAVIAKTRKPVFLAACDFAKEIPTV